MIVHRYVSGLQIDHELMYRRVQDGAKKKAQWDTLHIQQSPLDKSCGLVSCLMLAMLAKGLSRSHATSVAWSSRSSLRELWDVASEGYFRGTSAASIARHLRIVCDGFAVRQLRGSHAELCDKVAKEIERDNPCLLLIGASPKAQLHWVALVGVEYRGGPANSKQKPRDDVVALLGLDPESPAPICSAFNWRMPRGLRRKDQSSAKIATAAGIESYRALQAAVVLRRDQLRT